MIRKTTGATRPPRRSHWLNQIAVLDPVADCQEIHRITATAEFPWDYQRALELALLRTYCVPSISGLLSETGEFRDRPQRRYDDTGLLMGELVENGYASPRGRETLRVINRQHARYEISNDDMLYVLSTFVFDPIDWIDRFGYRRLHPHERTAAFHFYTGVGERMAIKDIPGDIEQFRRWRDDYEARSFRYSDTNREIGDHTIDLLASWYPAPLEPLVRTVAYSLLDEPMREAFGFPRVPATVGRCARAALKARGLALRLAPARRSFVRVADQRVRSYPDGYALDQVGACPFAAGPVTTGSGGAGSGIPQA